MKKLLLRSLFMLTLGMPGVLMAQKECNFTVQDTTAGQELRTTEDYLMSEKVFAGTSQYIFFSLSNSQDVPVLNFQLLTKSKDFTKANCIDKASRIYIQLANNKIVTLISASEEQCSGLMYDSAEQNNIRILTGLFLFTKGSFEDLDKSPISFIRVKYSTETVDYNIKHTLESETMKKSYNPDTYFINYLKCVK